MIMIVIDIYDNDLKIVQTLPAQMNITVTITFYFGSDGFKREVPGGAMLPPPPFGFYFTKAKFTSKKILLDEYEICLKMLEMAILETQIFKSFSGSMSPRKLVPLVLVLPPPPLKVLDLPLFSVSECCNCRFK